MSQKNKSSLENLVKIAAVDLDGTLLDHEKNISRENASAIKRLIENGYSVVITTGRVYHHALPYYQQLELSGPIVTADGAFVRAPKQKPICDAALTTEITQTILNSALAEGITALCFRADGIRACSKFDWNDDMDRHRRELKNHFSFTSIAKAAKKPVHKILLSANANALKTLEEKLPRVIYQKTSQIRNAKTLEFLVHGIDKVSGLACLGRPEQVTYFGDGNNDVGALSWAHQSVAMHHGSDAAKAAAKTISPVGDPATNFAMAVQLLLTKSDCVP